MPKKISELPGATLPLGGTELVPVVQGGATKHAPAYAIATRGVRDFGAKGDGATDDTAAFNAALAAGDVYIPEGIYRFASQPNAITAARSIRGAGRTATTLLIDYAAGDFLRIGDGAGAVPSFATIEGIAISTNVNRTSGATVRVFPAHHAVVRDIAIQPSGPGGSLRHYNGIQIDGGVNQFVCRVEGFEISLTQGFGIGLRSFPQDISIQNGIIGNCGGAGIDIQSGSGLYFANIDVITSVYGISCTPGPSDQIDAMFCTQVLGDTCLSDNWHFWGTGQTTNVHLNQCWASDSGGGVGFSINNPNLDGLTLANSSSIGNAVHGVQIAQGKNVQIVSGCIIGMNSQNGDSAGNEVDIGPGVSHVTVTDNAIGHVGVFSGQTAHAAFGINIEAGSGNDIVVTGNRISVGLDATGLCRATGPDVYVQDNSGWRTCYVGTQQVAVGQSSVTFGHHLIVDDPTKICVQVTALGSLAASGISSFWATSPTVGIGGSVTISTNAAVATNAFPFTFRITAFE